MCDEYTLNTFDLSPFTQLLIQYQRKVHNQSRRIRSLRNRILVQAGADLGQLISDRAGSTGPNRADLLAWKNSSRTGAFSSGWYRRN